jgi:YegS/Rv2252/BmrU family lipid kinase
VNDRRVFVIFNPGAGRGRAAARVAPYLDLLRRHLPGFEHAATTRAGEEIDLADRALASGFSTIVAVGGDGTWSVVADRILRSGRTGTALGILPAGTGNDFAKTFGFDPENPEEMVRTIARGRTARIDVGRVGERHFLNVLGFGFDIAAIEDAERIPLLRGDALYKFAAIRQLFRFPGLPVTIEDDTGRAERRDHLMLVIANARYFGGSFRIAPLADLHDGRLDAVSIRNIGPLARMRAFQRVAQGTHDRLPFVTITRSRRFRISFDLPVRFELDGEVLASEGTVVEAVAVPGALDLIVPDAWQSLVRGRRA